MTGQPAEPQEVDPAPPGVPRDQLTTRQYAALLNNTKKTTKVLNELVLARIAHRAGGCTDWYCEDVDVCRRVDAFTQIQLRLLLTMAVDEIARLRLETK